jgi:RHS repeat-associated protein
MQLNEPKQLKMNYWVSKILFGLTFVVGVQMNCYGNQIVPPILSYGGGGASCQQSQYLNSGQEVCDSVLPLYGPSLGITAFQFIPSTDTSYAGTYSGYCREVPQIWSTPIFVTRSGYHCPVGFNLKIEGTGGTLYPAWWSCQTTTPVLYYQRAIINNQYDDTRLYCESTTADPVPAPPASGCGSSMCCSAGAQVGNPILPATGEKLQTQTDFSDAAPHSLDFTRYYRTKWADITPAAGMGSNWNHRFAIQLTGAGNAKAIQLADGSQRRFTRSVSSSPWVNTDGTDTLVESASGTMYTSGQNDDKWQFNPAGKLVTMTQLNGWAFQLAYNPSGQLASVTNQFGRNLSFTYNASGQLASVSTPDGQQINYQYNSNTSLIYAGYSSNSTLNSSIQYLYENTAFPKALTGILDENNNRFATYAYDSAGRAISSEHAGGADKYQVNYGSNAATAAFNTSATITDPLGTQRSYSYSNTAGQLAVTGASSTSNGQMSGSDAASRVQNTAGLIDRETDYLGVQTMHTWDLTRRLPLATTRAAGRPETQTTTTTWHPTLRLPVSVAEAGRLTSYTYDALGNKLSQTVTDTATGQAQTTSWTYNAQGLVATETAPNSAVIQTSYDTAGNIATSRNALGHVTSYSHDAAGRVTAETAPNGLVTTYAYGSRGRLTGMNRGGQVTAYSYTPSGQIAFTSLPNGQQVSYQYDAAQRLIGAQDNRGNRITYSLDAIGNRVSEQVVDANSQLALATQRTINNLNRVAGLTVGGNNGNAVNTQFSFDANGEPVSSQDALGSQTTSTLDGLRRPVSTKLPDNAVASVAYNQLDQITAASDPKAVTTTYVKNAFGDVLSETSPDSGTTSFTRDVMGNALSKTDARGLVTTYQYDALNRVTQITAADGKLQRFTYDSNGSGSQIGYLSEIVDASGSTRFDRDAFGRIVKKTQIVSDSSSVPSTFVVGYAYTNAGDLAQITYPSGLRVSYTRNASGQIVGVNTQLKGLTKPVMPFVTGISYSALQQPLGWSWAHCETTTGTPAATCDSAARSFDAAGRMTANEFAAYQFDPASRITGITQKVWASLVDATTAATSYYPTQLTWQVAYDNRGRITGFNRVGSGGQNGNSSMAYTYDANSNRLSSVVKTTADTDLDGIFEATDRAQTTSQAQQIAQGSNRLLGFNQTMTTTRGTRTLATSTAQVVYGLDAAGNLTTDGLRQFTYDANNRHSQTTVGLNGEAAKITYLHNAQGQRVFKSEPQFAQAAPDATELDVTFIDWLKKNFGWLYGTAQANATLGQSYVYADGQLPEYALLAEYGNGAASGTGRLEYIWLPTESGQAIPIGVYRGSRFYAIHSDHLNTPRLMTDDSNKAVWQWPYSAFGDNKPTGILKATASPNNAVTQDQTTNALLKATAPAVKFNLRFPGQYFDDESNLNQNFNRSYQFGQGRYSQSDPIGLDGGWNRFGYANQNPLLFTDPTGEAGIAAVIGGMAVTGYGVSSLLNKQVACERACDLGYGEAVKSCGDPDSQDELNIDKSRRVLACKASCAFGSIMGRLLPGKLK